MKDFRIIWKQAFPIPELGLSGSVGSEAYLSQQEALACGKFIEARNQGAIEIHTVVRSVVMPQPPKAHEPPFVAQSRAGFQPPNRPEVKQTETQQIMLTEEQLARAVEIGVERALTKMLSVIEEKMASRPTPVRSPRTERPKVERSEPTTRADMGSKPKNSSPVLPEPTFMPEISFHEMDMKGVKEESTNSSQILSSMKKLRSLKGEAGT